MIRLGRNLLWKGEKPVSPPLATLVAAPVMVSQTLGSSCAWRLMKRQPVSFRGRISSVRLSRTKSPRSVLTVGTAWP
jgi:hypothetical protein